MKNQDTVIWNSFSAEILRLLLEASSAITLQTRERRLKTKTGGKNYG